MASDERLIQFINTINCFLMALMKLRFDNLVIRQFGNTYNCFLMALRQLPCNDFKVL